MLLHGAVLLGRSFVELLRFDPGFDAEPRAHLPSHAAAGTLRLGGGAHRTRRASSSVSLGRLPGVEAAGAINQLPLDDVPNWSTTYALRDAPAERT